MPLVRRRPRMARPSFSRQKKGAGACFRHHGGAHAGLWKERVACWAKLSRGTSYRTARLLAVLIAPELSVLIARVFVAIHGFLRSFIGHAFADLPVDNVLEEDNTVLGFFFAFHLAIPPGAASYRGAIGGEDQ